MDPESPVGASVPGEHPDPAVPENLYGTDQHFTLPAPRTAPAAGHLFPATDGAPHDG